MTKVVAVEFFKGGIKGRFDGKPFVNVWFKDDGRVCQYFEAQVFDDTAQFVVDGVAYACQAIEGGRDKPTINSRQTVDRTAPVIAQEGNLEVLADFPAFKYVRCPVWARLKHGSVFAVPMKAMRGGIIHKQFRLGSVIGYAVECGDDPLDAMERAKERGHDLHWANAMATSLTAWERPKETIFVLNLGDTITFEGIRFRLDPASNDNVKLTKIGDGAAL